MLKEAHKGSSRWHGSPYMATEISSVLNPYTLCWRGIKHIDGPEQDHSNSGALAMEPPQSHTKPSIYHFIFPPKSGDTRWDDNGSENDELYNNLINPVTGMIVSRWNVYDMKWKVVQGKLLKEASQFNYDRRSSLFQSNVWGIGKWRSA